VAHRFTVAVLLGAAVSVAGGAPALADAARPGATRSVVVGLEPSVDGVRFDVVGGDAFLRLTVDRGVEVVVAGYEGEPYLRVRPDGTVEENLNSPAVVLNEDRYGVVSGVDVPPVGAVGAVPDWRVVDRSGVAVWHDHRAHWMSTVLPPTIDADGLVTTWQVPVTVDGVPVAVQGALYRVDGPGPVWWAAALPFGGLVIWAGRRGVRSAALALVPTAVGALALLGVAAYSLPAVARPSPVDLALFLLGGVLAVLASSTRHRSSALVLLAGAGSALAIGAWVDRASVGAGVIPGADLLWLVRIAVAGSAGAGLVAVVFAGTQIVSSPRATND
jgi:hypothetical protein